MSRRHCCPDTCRSKSYSYGFTPAGKPRRTDAERENQAVICRTCPRRSRCDAASVGLHKMATWHCRAGESPAIPDDGPQPNKGPGDYLHDAILRWVGESPTADCQCRSRIARMNAWGPAGCREHLEEIVGWLAEEAKKRGWWRYAVCMPGSRLFLRRLVLRAIRKTEREAGVNLGA